MPEADRKQVPWGSREKNFENIVIWTWVRCSIADVVCGYFEIVTCELMLIRDSCQAVLVRIHTLSDASCYSCMALYSAVYTHVQLVVCPVPVNVDVATPYWMCDMSIFGVAEQLGCKFLDACTWIHFCMYIKNKSSSVEHYIVRPVLKHGPRSLTYMQVRSRECSVHNKCNTVSYMLWCADEQIFREFEQ